MPTSPTPPSTNKPPAWPVIPPTEHHWGTSPTPRQPKRRARILLAAAIGVVLLVTTAVVANGETPDPGPVPNPPTTESHNPVDPPVEEPTPEPKTVEVPAVAGTTLTKAKQTLIDHGLKATTRYRSTAEYPAGIVISQSRKAGAEVPPDTAIGLVVAELPPPPPSTAPTPPEPTPNENCDPSYPGVCLDPAVEDYDCAGGSGNGPGYVEGPVRVRPPDPFDLDRDGDGVGCDRG